MFDTDSERVLRFRNDDGVSFKSAALDPLQKYLVATACDRELYIFSVPNGEEGETRVGALVKKIKVSNLKMEPFGENSFEVAWSTDGSTILVGGDNRLTLVYRESWSVTLSSSFAHKKPICCITWLTDSIFATAGLEKIIKIWNYETSTLLFYFKTE
jgi:WD40 repeat protein